MDGDIVQNRLMTCDAEKVGNNNTEMGAIKGRTTRCQRIVALLVPVGFPTTEKLTSVNDRVR